MLISQKLYIFFSYSYQIENISNVKINFIIVIKYIILIINI